MPRPRRRAAAVAFAREASTALRDATRRVRSPLGRFLKPQAVANMRHMLDEATICGQMAKRLRADELGERAPRCAETKSSTRLQCERIRMF